MKSCSIARHWIWLAACVLLLLCVHARYRLALVVGDSMRPGLHTGDLLLVDKAAYRTLNLQRGDIVLARRGRELIVKRVVGLPGEEVALKRSHLFVNGSEMDEPYPIQVGVLDISPGRLFSGKFALLGDNRRIGIYENVHAIVSKREVLGKVVRSVRLWPW